MKRNFVVLFVVLFGLQAFSQEDLPMERLYLAEKAAGKALMEFRANPNTGNYDVTHYNLELTVDPAVEYIYGTVSTTFTTKESMNSIHFDFDQQMTVNQVTMNGNALAFSQTFNGELIINFSSTLSTGQSETVVINYEGDPESSGFGSFEQSTHAGVPIIWTLSEPYGAMAWWPCKQDLNDKAASIDVYITAPAQYTTVSNGIIVNETINGGLKTTHWEHNYPISPYLVAIAVSNFVKYTHMAGSGATPFPIDNYVYPEDLEYVQTMTPVTVDIMDFYEASFEPYPYNDEKYGHCQFGWGGGMEHTTISFMGGFNRHLIAHELAHQWFGDKITCGSWQDIWLNEGFAEYLSGMIIEEFDGESDFDDWKAGKINSITSSPDGSVYVPAADTLSSNRIFSGRLTYDKGSMVVHMLRKKLGETAFFQGVKNYLDDPDLAFSFAKTADLKAHLETASSMDLDEFFQDWVYGEGFPSYHIFWYQDSDNNVVLNFQQSQSHPSVTFFEAPVNLAFIGANNEYVEMVFDNTESFQSFTANIPFSVISVEIDPHFDLVSNNNTISLDSTSFILTDLVLYPNPVDDKLFVQKPANLEIKSYEVYNILGENLQTSKGFSEIIPTQNLARGIYFILFHTSEGSITQKIVKD